jgi:uncharacterized protein (TIGR03000 family)
MIRRIVALPALALFAWLLAPQVASAQMGQGFDLYRWAGHWGTPSEYYNGEYYPETGNVEGTEFAPEATSFYFAPQPYYAGFYYPQPDYTSFYNAPQPEFLIPENAALIDMQVPANAEVWFSGDATQQRGQFRSFVTPALEPGRNYAYQIRARWTDQNGNVVDRTQRIAVRPGDRLNVRFQ